MTNALHNLPLKLLRAKTDEAHDEILVNLESMMDVLVGLTHFIEDVKAKAS